PVLRRLTRPHREEAVEHPLSRLHPWLSPVVDRRDVHRPRRRPLDGVGLADVDMVNRPLPVVVAVRSKYTAADKPAVALSRASPAPEEITERHRITRAGRRSPPQILPGRAPLLPTSWLGPFRPREPGCPSTGRRPPRSRNHRERPKTDQA